VDFIATSATGVAQKLAEEILAGFDDSRKAWADATEDAASANAAADALRMAIAIAPLLGLSAGDGNAVAERMAEAMRDAKQREGSSYVLWQPSA
jgi:hypothetical protein